MDAVPSDVLTTGIAPNLTATQRATMRVMGKRYPYNIELPYAYAYRSCGFVDYIHTR